MRNVKNIRAKCIQSIHMQVNAYAVLMSCA